MNRPARVLLATVGFGDGHNRAAVALSKILQEIRPGTITEVIDPLGDMGHPEWARRRDRYYGWVKKHPRAYQTAYRFLSRCPWALRPTLRSFDAWFARHVTRFHPDVTLSTHVFCSWAAQRLPPSVRGRTVGVPTDLVDDAYWNRTQLDHYFVATVELGQKLARAGITQERIHVTGLPVDPVFLQSLPKGTARTRLELKPDRFTVLILGGGEGFGPVREAAAALAGTALSIQVVVVAGRNEGLRSRLEILKLRARIPLHVVGFTGRIHEYLDAADLVMTKPGGMTVAECLAKGRHMVLFGKPLSGPESMKEGYLLRHGLAEKASSSSDLVRKVEAAKEGVFGETGNTTAPK